MANVIFAILILIIGIIIFLIVKRQLSLSTSPFAYYLLILVAVLTLGMVAYVYSDTIVDPEIIIINPNTTQEMIKANQTHEYMNGNITLKCNDGFELRVDNEGNVICYDESPFGHSIIGLFQIFAALFAFCYVSQITIGSWRRYLTAKILYYIDKYQSNNNPINKYTDTGHAPGFTWAHEGFDGSMYASQEHKIHVAKNDLVAPISLHLIMKGKRQKVTSKWLWEYVGHNEHIFSSILRKYPYDPKTHEFLKDAGTIPEIYVPMKLPYHETKQFNSKEGNYGFSANRTGLIIKNLYKMQRDIEDQDREMGKIQKETLAEVSGIADKYATILDRVGDVKKENIITQITQGNQQTNYDRTRPPGGI